MALSQPGLFDDRELLAAHISLVLAKLRSIKPRVHCITNPVAQTLTANGLLALGAVPSMSVDPAEIADFVASSNGLLINLGMPDAARRAAIPIATQKAHAMGLPFVLDPVFAERIPARRALFEAVLADQPAILKLNSAEAGLIDPQTPSKRIDVKTGAIDQVRSSTRLVSLANGHPLLADVTATGCLLGAILAACAAIEPDLFLASLAGVSILNISAELAAKHARGPASFAIHLIDALSTLESHQIEHHLRIKDQE